MGCVFKFGFGNAVDTLVAGQVDLSHSMEEFHILDTSLCCTFFQFYHFMRRKRIYFEISFIFKLHAVF